MKYPWREWLVLTKTKVILLMLSTAYVGICCAQHSLLLSTANQANLLGIYCMAASGAIMNQLIDVPIDQKMRRTQHRPLIQKTISPHQALYALWFLLILGSSLILSFGNAFTFCLTLCGTIGYGYLYTVFLKKASPQNIVWGGLSGALPPLLGWVSVTNCIDAYPLLLVALIFIWTPPHFWALSIARLQDYEVSGIPMLPVTHGVVFTAFMSWCYTVLLIPVCLLIFIAGSHSLIFFYGQLALNLFYLSINSALLVQHSTFSWKSFKFSIGYLYAIFFLILIDYCGFFL